MSWAKVDDGWWAHRKTMATSLEASGLWVRALSWSCAQRCDLVPMTFVAMVGATAQTAAELVAAGLWDEAEGGWRIHDWAEYQDVSLSEKRAEAGRKGGKARTKASNPEANASNPEANASNPEANASKAKQPPEANCKQEAKQEPIPARPDPAQPDPSTTLAVVPAAPASPTTGRRYTPEFEEFWAACVRKANKADAAIAYAKARKVASHDDLVAAMRRHGDCWERYGYPDSKRPHPATWLNKGAWEGDDPPPLQDFPRTTTSTANRHKLSGSLLRLTGGPT